MTHELYRILKAYQQFRSLNERSVLVTLVALEGSSYRKPGVRMLLSESGQMIGAVSGGCVEKEIKLQAQEVFDTNNAKLMTYDGRYRYIYERTAIIKEDLELFKDIMDHKESSKLEWIIILILVEVVDLFVLRLLKMF